MRRKTRMLTAVFIVLLSGTTVAAPGQDTTPGDFDMDLFSDRVFSFVDTVRNTTQVNISIPEILYTPPQFEVNNTTNISEPLPDNSTNETGDNNDSNSTGPPAGNDGDNNYDPGIDHEPGDAGSINASLNNDTYRYADTAVIEGYIDSPGDDDITVYLDGRQIHETERRNGSFQAEFRVEKLGQRVVRVASGSLEKEINFQVLPTLSVQNLTIPGNLEPGDITPICFNVSTQAGAEVKYYHNGELEDQRHGRGEMCFDTRLEEGRNSFRAVAQIQDLSDQENRSVTLDPSNTRRTSNPEPGPDAQNSGFLGSIGSYIVSLVQDILSFFSL